MLGAGRKPSRECAAAVDSLRGMPAQVMTRFRDDGWPLCPGCDEDELWCSDGTALSLAGAPLSEWMRHELHCYRCGKILPAGTFTVAQA
jgi:hypothetical protein